MVLQLAEKIVQNLNNGSFALPFTAVRTLFPFYGLHIQFWLPAKNWG